MIAYYIVLIALALLVALTLVSTGYIAFSLSTQIFWNFIHILDGNGAIMAVVFLLPAAVIWSLTHKLSGPKHTGQISENKNIPVAPLSSDEFREELDQVHEPSDFAPADTNESPRPDVHV